MKEEINDSYDIYMSIKTGKYIICQGMKQSIIINSIGEDIQILEKEKQRKKELYELFIDQLLKERNILKRKNDIVDKKKVRDGLFTMNDLLKDGSKKV